MIFYCNELCVYVLIGIVDKTVVCACSSYGTRMTQMRQMSADCQGLFKFLFALTCAGLLHIGLEVLCFFPSLILNLC